MNTKSTIATLSAMGTSLGALQPALGPLFIIPGVGSLYFLFIISSFLAFCCVLFRDRVNAAGRRYVGHYYRVVSGCVAFPWAGLIILGGSVLAHGTGLVGALALVVSYFGLGALSMSFL